VTEHESTFIPVLALMLLFVAVWVVTRLRARYRLQRRTVLCPHRLRHADCVVRIDERSGRAARVVHCRVLPDPACVDCDESCLGQLDGER
jgi:hypothetical protein